MISSSIRQLVQYALESGLIEAEDKIYATNALLELFQEDEYVETQEADGKISLELILSDLMDYAYKKGLMPENSILYRDLFDTKIMGCLTERPSTVTNKFNHLYDQSKESATDYFYKFSQDTDYIRRYRIKKDMKWAVDSSYGSIDISINLSKPEKDPRDIAAAKHAKQSGYPTCLLCKENVGYAGRVNHPARQNHRIIPCRINNEDWGFQYSPYVYYNEHCIVFNQQHTPMKINKATFVKLFDFINWMPHYFIGSNADLPIVGGSILSHDHFQGGRYQFPMEKTNMEDTVTIKGYENVEVGILNWPMSVIRTRSKDYKELIELGDYILNQWRNYTDEEAFIYASTDGEPHNTITPVARKVGDTYELDLALRNNITTQEFPMGVYHPHEELHHIKKENIGLIEVMGLAVLPARLKDEMELLKEYILAGKPVSQNDELKKHEQWVTNVIDHYPTINEENIMDILEKEIGDVFVKVLEDAGVYKRDEAGKGAFLKFLLSL